MKRALSVVFALLCAGTLFLAGCGGGGGGGGGGPAASSVTGTAATGAAIPDATITLKDAAGTTVTTTTDADGNYSIDTTGLAAPFLVQVDDAVNGVTYYSVSASADAVTVINVTPLTDLIIRSWYEVQGVTVDEGFADPVANPAPTPVVVEVIADVVLDIVQLWMDQAGVTAENFDLISTPFAADGTGVDQVLDQLTIDTTSGSPVITIEDAAATTTQETTMTYDTETGAISVDTLTEGENGTSSSTGGTVVPVETTQQDALAGITAAGVAFSAAVNAGGADLADVDLLPFIATDALWGGLDKAHWAMLLADYFKGKTLVFTGIAITSLDTATNVAGTMIQFNVTQNGQTASEKNDWFAFKKVGDSWLMYGDQRIGLIDLRAGMTTNGGIAVNTTLGLDAYIQTPEGAVTGVTVTGGPWTDLQMTPQTPEQWPWGDYADTFSAWEMDPSPISGGMTFTFDFTPAVGDPVSYTRTLNAITTEPIYYTDIGTTGDPNDIATAALGSPRTVAWTLPATFAIAQVRIGTVLWARDPVTDEEFKCDSGNGGDNPVLGTASTSAEITIPDMCGDADNVPFRAEVYVHAIGINGESTIAYYMYGESWVN